MIELVADDDGDGKRFLESYRCSPDPVQRASVDRPHVVIDPAPGWKFHAQANKQAFAVCHEADDTIILAHGIAARDVAVRTATTQFFEGTNTDLDGTVTQRGDRYIFGATKRDDPTSSIRIVSWRCSDDEVAIVVALSSTHSGAARALPVALGARCLAATDPVPAY